MEKTIKIGEKEITMKATGNTPKRYREEFNKDLIVEYQNLLRQIDDNGNFTDKADLGVVERLAYIMAKQYDSNIGSLDEWLDGFGVMDIFNAVAQIFSVWVASSETLSDSKKKADQ